MIVSELVMHHDYQRGVAFDLSERRNHGVLEHVSTAGDTVVFTGGPGRVRIRPSDTLSDLQGLRVQVRFKITPTGTAHRHNLIEGYLCFALVVNSDWSLAGSIYDRNNSWTGATSPPGVVQPNRWHTATFVHDGISAARVFIDGVPVGEGFASPGPVRSVRAPYGLAVGHWPDPDDRYTLEGAIDEVKVWRVDKQSVKDLVDLCCLDRETWDEISHRAHVEGYDGDDLETTARQIIDLGSRLADATYGGGADSRREGRRLAADAVLALKTGNRDALGTVIGDVARDLFGAVGTADVQALGTEAIAMFDDTPGGPLVRRLLGRLGKHDQGPLPPDAELIARALCMDWALPARPPVRDDDRRPDPKNGGKNGTKETDDQPDPDPDLGGDWGFDSDRHDDDPSGRADSGSDVDTGKPPQRPDAAPA